MSRARRSKWLLMVSVITGIGMLIYIIRSSERSQIGSFTTNMLKRLETITINQRQILHPSTPDSTSQVNDDIPNIIKLARKVSTYNRTVLVTMVNDAYLPFTYSWLCNTKDMNIHKSVLIITTDEISKQKLERDWPEIGVIFMDVGKVHGAQVYSHVGYVKIMIRRTEILLAIIAANIETFIFEVDCLWFANPVPEFQNITGYDILVNPVTNKKGVYAGGFTFLYTTDNAKRLWKELTTRMLKLGELIANMTDDKYISEGDNDQQYFSSLIVSRYSDVKIKELSLDIYADGQWYNLSEAMRNSSHPIVVNNNWVLGNQKKVERAKKWGHWFIKDDLSCDMEQVHKVVY